MDVEKTVEFCPRLRPRLTPVSMLSSSGPKSAFTIGRCVSRNGRVVSTRRSSAWIGWSGSSRGIVASLPARRVTAYGSAATSVNSRKRLIGRPRLRTRRIERFGRSSQAARAAMEAVDRSRRTNEAGMSMSPRMLAKSAESHTGLIRRLAWPAPVGDPFKDACWPRNPFRHGLLTRNVANKAGILLILKVLQERARAREGIE